MLETVDHRVEARVAHPLYGEVRRKRAASTRLRRLRGLVARELARADECDDVHVAVRRATLSLDSDLEPGADLLDKGSPGRYVAHWICRWRSGWRERQFASAGDRTRTSSVLTHLSALSRGEEADAVLAAIPTGELNGDDRGRLAFLRATNRFFTLG